MGRTVLLLVGGVLLGVVAMVIARTTATGEQAETPTHGLSQEIDGLRSDVRELREVVERQRALPSTPSGNPPTPLSQAPDSLVEQIELLRAELKELADRLEAQSAESRNALADMAAKVEAGANAPEPMPDSLPDTPPNLQAFDRIGSRSEDEVTDEHILWTYDQVLGTYGRPTGIQPNPLERGGGIKFLYDLPGGGTCIFWFKGGKVVRVYP